MKKILAISMALAMLASAMIVNAGATYKNDLNHLTEDTANNTDTAGKAAGISDTTNTTIGEQTVPVKVQTVSNGGTTNVYAVSFSATEVTFTWNNSATTIWNPETLKYETKNDSGSWNKATQSIAVNNYSDVGINVTPDTPTPTSADAGVTLTVTDSLNLASAYDGTVTGSVKSGNITVTVSGIPANTYLDATKIADITLTVVRQ